MANCITLTQAKTHLKVEQNDEDDHITLFIDAAHDYVKNFINQDIPAPVPAAIKASILLIVGDLYKNREAYKDAQSYKNEAVDNLLWPYRADLGI